MEYTMGMNLKHTPLGIKMILVIEIFQFSSLNIEVIMKITIFILPIFAFGKIHSLLKVIKVNLSSSFNNAYNNGLSSSWGLASIST